MADASVAGLEDDARALAKVQRSVERAPRLFTRFQPPPALGRALEVAKVYLASSPQGGAALLKAAEWFLDNYYLIRRVARQVEEDLPRGFVRHLPRLTSTGVHGLPRIEALACALVAHPNLALDVVVLRRFIDAYQEVAPLTIAELWALPTTLRAAVLARLLDALVELDVPTYQGGARAKGVGTAGERAHTAAGPPSDPNEEVERSIRTLRALDTLNWKSFFERSSRVESILGTDPAGVYATMDFATCDSYRKVVEALAWATGIAEEDVALRAITLAASSAGDARRGHVGYYLVSEGRASLEAELSYHAVGFDRLRRWSTGRPTIAFLLPLAAITAALVVALACLTHRLAEGIRGGSVGGSATLYVAVIVLVASAPAAAVAIAALQIVFARLLPPRTLPKLDFANGMPPGTRTLVVIPTLLGRAADVTVMIRQIELHYLSNPDALLQFALLTDDVDVRALPDPATANLLLESASTQIVALNVKHGTDGVGPFHLLHRSAPWNAREDRFMGWERKRGKLEELNRLLRGDLTTSYCRHVGEPSGLLDIRFVITLDSDTELPMGTANRLVGVLAHPLNRAVVDEKTGRVVAGYTLVQPRVDTSPSSTSRSIFSKAFAGDVGFDIYTHASSELYQDLFGSGIYVGKGIYDVDAFTRSVDGRVPENSLVSHDLFEGVHGRAALATDIVLFEGYPASYVTYAMRMHRWVRGDWQLLPWLFTTVPSANGARLWNRLAAIDRWKIADNLRRSVSSLNLVVLFVLGWTWLPGSPWLWTMLVLGMVVSPFVPGFVNGRRLRGTDLTRAALALVFVAYEACVVTDAIARVLVRTTITRKYLLEWTSAAHTAFRDSERSARATCWRTMRVSPFLALAIAALVASTRPIALFVAAPLLAVWALAPEIARWVSAAPTATAERVTEGDRRKLRLLARRTWRFFDTFVGPDDQWLPVDNYQEEPREQTAHRTSPTNIGLTLLSTLSAYDFGYIGPSELSVRLRRLFESLTRMAHYQGHLLNWYDTKNLQPLLPRYVSTVDSGNFAGCLIALEQGCRDVCAAPIFRAEAWEGLRDSLDLLEEAVRNAPKGASRAVLSVIARMQRGALHGQFHLDESFATLQTLTEVTSPELDRELLAFLQTGEHRHEADLLRMLRTTVDRFHEQLQQMRREWEALFPWLALSADADAIGLELPTALRLTDVAASSRDLLGRLEVLVGARAGGAGQTAEIVASAMRLRAAFESAEAHATGLVADLTEVARRADAEVRGMDFALLYDAERRLFHIGYNATIDQVDEHHYDLLASEARLASYVAIIKRDVPESHWYALGRPMTEVDGAPLLLSWGGTMFEYLMPNLLMKSQQGTLLARTTALVVTAQRDHGKARSQPWGVSESAYARLDAEQTYQYRSFGVPGLGFKRGLEDDHVVAPYASLLALSLRPKAVLDNLRELEAMGMLGTYGLFESLDFTPARVLELAAPGKPYAVVRSYMAHHQGMVLVSLGNFLNQRTMLDRFHADARVQTCDVLLNEQAPLRAPSEWPLAVATDANAAVSAPTMPRPPPPWLSAVDSGRQAFVLTNGRLTTLVTASGGGGLRYQEVALTRFVPDATCDDEGLWLYLRDEETGNVWRATSDEGRTTYAMHKVELHLRKEGISTHVGVTVAAADDVEVRQITLHNETNRPRRITLTSAGRPVLVDAGQAQSHPAFSSMFVESDYVRELEGLVFARRHPSSEEMPLVLVHRLVREGSGTAFAGYETDRNAFYGRGTSARTPASLSAQRGPLKGRAGAVLDPMMAIMASIELPPNGSATVAFVTTVSRSRAAAMELSRKYGSMHAVRWAFRDAELESPRHLARTKLDPGLLPVIQRLFSAMTFAEASLRASPEARLATPPSQRRLWARGISGDDPIVLVHVADPDAPILREALAAQRYLRSCGVRLDLVLIDEAASGYVTEGPGTLRNVLIKNDGMDWLNRHGGIFVLVADQIDAKELRHLEACARVVLDTRDHSLHARLTAAVPAQPKLPRFEGTLVDDSIAPPPAPRSLVMDNGTGGFAEDGREYVVRVGPGQPTPAPWCNVLANSAFGTLVSESSFGATWSLNSGENRLTPWRNDPVFDTPSEALYLRDEETAAVWSPTPRPAGLNEQTVVRHGAGYTIYERESHGLVQELTVFVPVDASLKVIRLRVRNTQARHRRVTATYYAEWVLGSRRESQRPFVVSELDRENACLLATCDWNAEFSGRVAFVAAKNKPHGVTADRAEFLGARGDYALPEALERWGLSGRVDLGEDPCAALQVHLDLAPGEQIETHFLLGQAASREAALELVSHFRDSRVVDAAWRALGTYWDDMLGAVRVKTPEPAMDLLLNRWLLYQTLSARVFGRTGFYQSSGAFGFRDQLQDVLALLHTAPALARAHILEAASHQFEEGDVLHWWHPPSGRGVRTRCSDDMAWLPYVTAEYVAATGDASILDVTVPFLAGDPLRAAEHDRYSEYIASGASASLFEHGKRALERALTHGSHGLPLMGDGDWNDGMSRVGAEGRGESVWLGWFLCATMDRFGDLCAGRAGAAEGPTWRERSRALREKVKSVAWDGHWYLRAFHDDGSLLGSSTNQECRIDSIAQSWAVLSNAKGAAHDDRAREAVHQADKALVRETDRLALLLWPPFDVTPHDPGYIRAYPPGVRENGGQYTHAATWLGFAHAALGDGERATRIFRLLNPSLHALTADDASRYRVEPYALAGDVYSVPPWVGRGGWTWYTGAAAWMWRLGAEAILGLRREGGALRIDPCIPPRWDGFEAWINEGAQRLHIVVDNPDHISQGVASITIDNVRVDANRISMKGLAPGMREVHVRLGNVPS